MANEGPTAADVRTALDESIDQLSHLPAKAWEQPAAGLTWTCRETIAHVLDDLGSFAMQLSGTRGHGAMYTPLRDGYQPRPDGPAYLFWPDELDGSQGIIDCLDAVGGLAVAVVAAVPPDRTGWHVWGTTDAPGLAAMCITEVLLHSDDILRGQKITLRPDDRILRSVLTRIFPHAVRTDDPWYDLHVATGRTDDTRGITWQWDSSVR